MRGPQRGKKVQRLDLFAATSGQCRRFCKKKGTSDPRAAAISVKAAGAKGLPKSSFRASNVCGVALPRPDQRKSARVFPGGFAPFFIFACLKKSAAARKTKFLPLTGSCGLLQVSWMPLPHRSKLNRSWRPIGCSRVSSS